MVARPWASFAAMLFPSGEKAKARANLAAIDLLKKLEAELVLSGLVARVGSISSWVYFFGMVMILFAPRTIKKS